MAGFSVIIPTCNRQAETDRAVKSVLSQTELPDEIIVVDDGSKPAYQPPDRRVKLIRHHKTKGAGAARNSGIKAANGQWLGFLDSDDLWHQDRLANIKPYLLQMQTPTEVLGCGFHYIDKHKGTDRGVIPKGAETLVRFASGCWFNPGSCMVVRRQVFTDVGFYCETLERLEDYEWFLRLARAGGRLVVAPAVLVDINKGARPKPDVILRSLEVLDKTVKALSAPAQAKSRAFLALELASAYWYSGAYLRACRALLVSWCHAPRLRLQPVA
ncbi:MAG: glycosyltransferase family 2 protein [Rhodobacterales bacterium]